MFSMFINLFNAQNKKQADRAAFGEMTDSTSEPGEQTRHRASVGTGRCRSPRQTPGTSERRRRGYQLPALSGLLKMILVSPRGETMIK